MAARQSPTLLDTWIAEEASRAEPELRALREEFSAAVSLRAKELIDLANEYDHRDHQVSPDGAGSALQDDCQRVRKLARQISRPSDGT